jgi:hypothetical protein
MAGTNECHSCIVEGLWISHTDEAGVNNSLSRLERGNGYLLLH